MTYEESGKILHGDVTGLEFMTDEVYSVCLALIDIVECDGGSVYDHDREVEWAEAFVVSYKQYEEDHNA